MRTRSVLTHSAQAIAEGSLIALLVVGLMAGTALAGKSTTGKPSGGSGSSSLGYLVAADQNGDGGLNWGDSVTYSVSTSATEYPYVSTSCVQDGVQVLSGSAGFFPSYPWPSAQVVPLTTMRWTGGAADCTARLYSNGGKRTTTLATIAFHVDP